MPQPDSRLNIVPVPLQNVSVQYRNQSYIADRVFRIIEKVAPKAVIGIYDKGAWFRDEAKIRGPGARAGRGGFVTGYVSINTKEYAFAKEVTDEDVRNSMVAGAPPFKPAIDAIEFATDKIDLKKESRVAQMIFSGTWSGVSGGTNATGLWAPNDATNTFVSSVLTAIETIRSSTGIRPNVLVLDSGTYQLLKQNDALLNRIRYTQRGVLGKDLLAAMFDLDEVLIGETIVSIAKEKKDGTDWNSQNVWEKNQGKGSAFLCYRPSGPGLKTPSAGYQARAAYRDGSTRRTAMWREEAEHQDVYEVAEETDIVTTGADLGYLWYNTRSA